MAIHEGSENVDVLDPRAMPPMAALRAFVAVAQCGGIRKAARRLQLDHTVVGRHVRSLEQSLGVALFHRDGSSLRITEAGRRYQEQLVMALKDIAAASRELTGEPDSSTVRLWSVPGFAAQWLLPQIARLEESDPLVRVEVKPTDIPADFSLFEADIDIRYVGDSWGSVPDRPAVRREFLARPELFPVASPGLLNRIGPITSVGDLLTVPLLHEDHDKQWTSWFEANGYKLERPIAGPLMYHAHLALLAARQGRGIALANRFLAVPDLETGQLVRISIPGVSDAVIGGYSLSARSDQWNKEPIMKLRRFLRAAAAEWIGQLESKG